MAVMASHQRLEIKHPDSAGRILIGKKYKDKLFTVKEQPNGDILLSPVVVRHEREAWLFDNPEAMASLDRGLEQSARGEGTSLGSFAQFADEPIGEDE